MSERCENKNHPQKLGNQLLYAFHVIFHPFDGFWDLKFERRGSVRSATILYVLLALSQLMKRQLTAYLFNPDYQTPVNVLEELALSLLPYALWVISCWCVTTLMDGEGSMADIYKATGYALTPAIIINVVSVIVSQVVTLNEQSIYTYLAALGTLWSVALIFCSLLVTQQFSLLKGVLGAIVIIVGMLIIVFLALLVFFLIQQVYGFVVEVYNELSLRFNQ